MIIWISLTMSLSTHNDDDDDDDDDVDDNDDDDDKLMIVILTLKDSIQDFFQSSHCAANCFQ